MRIIDVLRAPQLRVFAEDQLNVFPELGQPAVPVPVTPQPQVPQTRRAPFLSSPLGGDPREHALTVNDILHPDTPEGVYPKARPTHVIAKELMLRGRKALRGLGVKGGVIAEPNPRHNEILARAIASEVKSAINRDTDKPSVDWYTKSFKEALTIASILHPEIAQDPNAKMAFIAALAITSQGEKVIRNATMAESIYGQYKQTGVFPTNIKAKKAPSMNTNFKLLNQMIANLGTDGTREFLNSKFTVRDLNKLGYKVSGENKNTDVYGSVVFGPKIGQGFYQNLNGNYDPVTMDLWFMRAWGRLTGTLVGKELQPAVLEKQRNRFVTELHNAGMPVPNSPQALIRLANKIHLEHDRYFLSHRAEYDTGARKKEDIVNAADRYMSGLHGINESPSSGQHRTWMRSVVNRAREILTSQGINITNADLQAIWWNPEKELYKKLGGKKHELRMDYAEAFKTLANNKGIDDATINSTLSMDR